VLAGVIAQRIEESPTNAEALEVGVHLDIDQVGHAGGLVVPRDEAGHLVVSLGHAYRVVAAQGDEAAWSRSGTCDSVSSALRYMAVQRWSISTSLERCASWRPVLTRTAASSIHQYRMR